MLDAQTQRLDARLQATDRRLAELDGSVRGADASLSKFSKVSAAVGSGLKTTATIAKRAAIAFVAVKAALTAATSSSAAYAKEIKNNSALMKLSVEDTQAWASATASVGIDMEKLGDISKDTSEKIGDFLNTGGGGFQDFADAMGFTTVQAKAAADEFQGMAGPNVLQAMVNQMEAAGVNAEQMSHALEGMASDTTKLIPLLTEGGKAANKLKNDFFDTSVVLNETDIAKLGELSTNFKRLGETFDGTMGKFSVEYADQMNSMIESTQQGLKIIGDEFASGSFTDRLNSFYDAFTDSWAVAMGDNITVFDDFSGDATEVINFLASAWLDFVLTLPINLAIAGNHIKEIFQDILDEVKIGMAEANLLIQEGLDFAGLGGDISGAQLTLDSINEEASARDKAHDDELERLREEKEAILEKFYAEQEAATIKRETYAADSSERMKLIADENEAERLRLKGLKKDNEDESKSKSQTNSDKIKSEDAYMKAANTIGNTLFENNKGVQAGLVITNAAVGITRQFADLPYPAALASSAAIAISAAAQLSNLKSSSSSGGGSISGAGGSGTTPDPQSFQQETSSLELTDSGSSGSQSFNLTVPDGDEIGQAIANWLNQAKAEGRT